MSSLNGRRSVFAEFFLFQMTYEYMGSNESLKTFAVKRFNFRTSRNTMYNNTANNNAVQQNEISVKWIV